MRSFFFMTNPSVLVFHQWWRQAQSNQVEPQQIMWLGIDNINKKTTGKITIVLLLLDTNPLDKVMLMGQLASIMVTFEVTHFSHKWNCQPNINPCIFVIFLLPIVFLVITCLSLYFWCTVVACCVCYNYNFLIFYYYYFFIFIFIFAIIIIF